MSQGSNLYTVYLHRNKINNKEYIGISKNKVETRWRKGKGYTDQIFGKAINKYGWDNFEHFVLHTNLSENEAKRLEQHYIAERNTLIPNGYNVSPGGETGSLIHVKTIICVETGVLFSDIDTIYEYYQDYFEDNSYTITQQIKECLGYERKYIVIKPMKNYDVLHFQYYNDYKRFPKNSSISFRQYKIDHWCSQKFEDRKMEAASIYYLGVPKRIDIPMQIMTRRNGYARVCGYCGKLFNLSEDEYLNADNNNERYYCPAHIFSENRLANRNYQKTS